MFWAPQFTRDNILTLIHVPIQKCRTPSDKRTSNPYFYKKNFQLLKDYDGKMCSFWVILIAERHLCKCLFYCFFLKFNNNFYKENFGLFMVSP